MADIEGWLEDEEADLLIAALSRSLADLPGDLAVVEVGSYQGKTTVVIGSVLRALAPGCKMHAIDPHEGNVSLGTAVTTTAPTLEKFKQNIQNADLTHVVQVVQLRSYETEWDLPIRFLLIDGLHDYTNVSRDLRHFEPWLVPGAFIAFHDYWFEFPDVIKFVDELVASDLYDRIECVISMTILKKNPIAVPAPPTSQS